MVVSRALVFRFTAFALVGMSLPLMAAAQGRGGAVGHAPAVAHAGPVVVHATPAPRAVAPARAPVRVSPANNVRVAAQPRLPGTGSRIRRPHPINIFPSANFTDFQDVPGLGFDFPHLAAVGGGNTVRRRHFNHFGGNAPFFGGVLLGSPSVIIEQQPALEEQPAEDVAANDVAQDEPVVRRHRRLREPELEASAAPAPEPSPQRDVDPYVLIRRDGSLVFAVGYTWVDDSLRYITPEGVRRTIDRNSLDLNATQQFNEQRGVSFRAPA